MLNMSRKCPTCEKTVYMGERWIFSEHLSTFLLYFDFDRRSCWMMFFFACVQCQRGFHKMSRTIAKKYRFWFHQRSNLFRKQLLGYIWEYSLVSCQRIKDIVVFDHLWLQPRVWQVKRKSRSGTGIILCALSVENAVDSLLRGTTPR